VRCGRPSAPVATATEATPLATPEEIDALVRETQADKPTVVALVKLLGSKLDQLVQRGVAQRTSGLASGARESAIARHLQTNKVEGVEIGDVLAIMEEDRIDDAGWVSGTSSQQKAYLDRNVDAAYARAVRSGKVKLPAQVTKEEPTIKAKSPTQAATASKGEAAVTSIRDRKEFSDVVDDIQFMFGIRNRAEAERKAEEVIRAELVEKGEQRRRR